ncbi:MAG: hypothetical protein ACTSX8_01610 [Alphaproteobacteria bacterium]
MAGFAAMAGPVPLYPLCRGAETWLLEYVEHWWGEGHHHPRYERLSMLYAHAHSVPGADVSGVFVRLTDRDAARDAITTWALTLNCTQEQEYGALESVEDAEDKLSFPPAMEEAGPLAGVDDQTWLGSMAARVAAKSGCSVWELLWSTPAAAVTAVAEELRQDDHRDMCMAAGEIIADPNSWDQRALLACMEICRRIKKRIADSEAAA